MKKLLLTIAAWEVFWFAMGHVDRRKLYRKARAAADASGRPLLVVGTPDGMYPCGDVTVDIRDSGECPDFRRVVLGDEPLPFPDGYFGAVFVSHVVEHTCRPDAAMAELQRVSGGRVFNSYARPWRLATWYLSGWITTRNAAGEFSFRRPPRRCNIPKFLGDGHAPRSRNA